MMVILKIAEKLEGEKLCLEAESVFAATETLPLLHSGTNPRDEKSLFIYPNIAKKVSRSDLPAERGQCRLPGG